MPEITDIEGIIQILRTAPTPDSGTTVWINGYVIRTNGVKVYDFYPFVNLGLSNFPHRLKRSTIPLAIMLHLSRGVIHG